MLKLVGGGGVEAVFAFYFEVGTEVDKQAVVDAGGGKIVDKLYFVCIGESLDGFKFNYHFVFNENVCLKFSNIKIFVFDDNGFFGFGGEGVFA